jgi:hypothetical protein
MGARNLILWETPGGPARALFARLPGERREAGYSLSARLLEPETTKEFAGNVVLTPALYDVV